MGRNVATKKKSPGPTNVTAPNDTHVAIADLVSEASSLAIGEEKC
jgi:hypothetical protein